MPCAETAEGKMRNVITTTTAVILAIAPASAREIHVLAAVPLAPVQCLVADNGWIGTTTGPCPDFKVPPTIAVGASFSESGNQHVISVIKAMQAESEMPEIPLKTGEWMCTAAESESDLRDRRLSHRMWLYIPKCAPR
jgi:hypothetical protein